MTSKAQRSANRRNAKKSTGPKTNKGKAASSANARKHGLTTAPEHRLAQNWYRVILNDITAIPSSLKQNAREEAAYILAQTEARLDRIRRVEENMHLKISSQTLSDPEHFGFPEDVVKSLNSDTRSMLRLATQASKAQGAIRKDQIHLLARYRREAEAAQRDAFRRWGIMYGLMDAIPETNPITP